MKFLVIAAAAASVASSVTAANVVTSKPSASLPVVDLGYTLQQATELITSNQLYNFSNIRYARPPLGNLRFAAPQPPAKNRTVQTGKEGRICYQAQGPWAALATQFVTAVLLNNTDAIAAFVNGSANANVTSTTAVPKDPRETEDCLFLDVVVPQTVFDQRNKRQYSGAPVIVWIYGGGYTSGDKNAAGNPVGLIEQSKKATKDGIIFVSFNYRLGAFGWLGGPTVRSNGTANAALLDQRLALEWVKSHIGAFGGNPKQVTIMGESAGGGSIMHQITAYANIDNKPLPFQQAILQSPGWQPLPGNAAPEATLTDFLSAANVSTLQAARQLSGPDLQAANLAVVNASPYGTYTFSPTVDGTFVPALPGTLLLQKGAFHTNNGQLKLLIGHNANEGLAFTNPVAAASEASFAKYISQFFPTVSNTTLDLITKTLYPSPGPATVASYNSSIARVSTILADVSFVCNTDYLARAFDNQTYNYLFAIPPALHGQDVSYTFAPPAPANVSEDAFRGVRAIADTLQGYITRFAVGGDPNGKGLPSFEKYGGKREVVLLGAQGVRQVPDPEIVPERCGFWQKALYF